MPGFVAAVSLSLGVVAVVGATTPLSAQARRAAATPDDAFSAAVVRFDHTADSLRQALRIPGMSAAIVQNQVLAWSKGYGLSDVEARTPATPDTPYEIASVVKPMSATLLLRLVEQGRVSLDDPMAKYSSGFTNDAVKVRHILTHTSQGVPGTAYVYNGNAYARLFDVIVKTTNERFRKYLVTELLAPIGAKNSVPGNDVGANPPAMVSLLGEANLAQFTESLGRLARSYKLFGDEVIRTQNRQSGLSTADGLISSVTDIAKFDIAIDRHQFLRDETQRLAWTPTRSNDGKELPYGLGWFVQSYNGTRLVWHNGYLPEVASALYLKLPDAGVTLILLANSDALSAPFRLAAGDVTASAFACAFLREFANTERSGPPECVSRSVALATRWLDSARANTPKRGAVDARAFDRILGDYEARPGVAITIKRADGRLVRETQGAALEIIPSSDTSFFIREPFIEYVAERDRTGGVVALRARRNGRREARAPRIVHTAVEDSLVALEKASWVAWQKRDVSFFQNFLSDDHVDVHPNGVLNKAAVLAGVAAPCNVQSYTGDTFRFVQFDSSSALLTYRADQNTTCGGTQIPSPMWVGSLYARRNGRWVNVMFQESPLPRKAP